MPNLLNDWSKKVAFTAHFYGNGDPRKVIRWKVKDVLKWHGEAVTLFNEMNAAPPEDE